jgi:acyl carrier protein
VDANATEDLGLLRARIKEMIVRDLKLEHVRPEEIVDDAPLFVEGLGLDSLDALQLVVSVEENFGVLIPDEEVGKVAFASVSALARFIVQERGKG